MLLRLYKNDMEKLYRIKLSKGKSPQSARYEVNQMKTLIDRHGKNTKGRNFKYGGDAYMDYDEDGIMNAFDCRPLHPMFQDDKYFYDHNNVPYLNKDEYTKTTKYMTHDEFMALAKLTSPMGMDDNISDSEYAGKVIDQKKVNEYAKVFKKIKTKKQRFPTPFLVFKSDSKRPYRHEGRHRTAALDLAFSSKKKAPVYIVKEKKRL